MIEHYAYVSHQYENWDVDTKIVIVSGGAVGVDKRAAYRARELGLEVEEELPDFSDGYDVGEYHRRNDRIIEKCDKIIVFWNGTSRGSYSVIQKCLQRRKHVEVIFD